MLSPALTRHGLAMPLPDLCCCRRILSSWMPYTQDSTYRRQRERAVPCLNTSPCLAVQLQVWSQSHSVEVDVRRAFWMLSSSFISFNLC